MWWFKVPVAPQDQLGVLSLHVEGLIKAFIPPEVTSTGLNPGAEQLRGGLCAPAPGRLCVPWDLAIIHAFIQDFFFFFLRCDLLSRAFWSIFTLNAFG